MAALTLSIPRALTSTPLDQMFRARSVVEQLGPFGYHAYDTWNYVRSTWLRPPPTPAELDDAVAWLRERAPLRAGGRWFGAARGKNLIVVQVESLQDFVVDFAIDGQAVMPHLRGWTSDSLRFTNVTDQTSEGRTSDAEFTTMASLLPLDHGAVAFRFPGNHYTALPRVLTEHGYATLSAVAFEPGFWNRQVMHPSYGFERSLFEPDFQMTEQIGWGLNDHDFLQQMVPRIEKLPRPFAAWLITLSLHHPFESFPDAHKVLKLGALEGTSLGNYLHTMRFFDQALEDFRSALARDGLLDDTMLVVFGDHDAGFARDAALARTIGIGADDIAWTLNDRVPFFIRTAGGNAAAAGLAGERAQPAGQTDFAPTILSLLGVDASALAYVGRNLLAAPDDAPVPRPYGDWLDSRHLFFARGAASICVDAARRAAVDAAACAAADTIARRERDVSRLVVVDDLQERLRAPSREHHPAP
jgi:phosphoglycerol transferase MdoB-like AlkP superfamily enzyme